MTLSDGDSALIKSRQRHDVTVDKAPDYRRFITVINPWELKKQLTRPDLFSMLPTQARAELS